MKKIVASVALVALFFTSNSFAQEVAKTEGKEKTEKSCCKKDKKACSKEDKKACSKEDKKACASEKKACCAKKA